MKVLVTGTDGYIGSLLGPYLTERGHQVVGVDTMFYQDGQLYQPEGGYEGHYTKDVRKVEESDLEGFDACFHLAELSNDALGQLDPDITFAINHRGSARLAKLCKDAGIPRFVYSSSCSVYGVASQEIVSEETAPKPVTAYGKCKILVEEVLSNMASEDFSPTMLRNATAYGPSPKMRFDIVVNNLSGLAWTTGKITMTSDGTPWRPLVHVLDICQAFACVLEAPKDAVNNQILNVGDNDENYRVREVAKIVADVFTGSELTFGPSDGDNRSYKVSFEKINRVLPAFKPTHNVEIGATQLKQVFEKIGLTKEMFEHRGYTRLKQLKYLIDADKIDEEFYWSEA